MALCSFLRQDILICLIYLLLFSMSRRGNTAVYTLADEICSWPSCPSVRSIFLSTCREALFVELQLLTSDSTVARSERVCCSFGLLLTYNVDTCNSKMFPGLFARIGFLDFILYSWVVTLILENRHKQTGIPYILVEKTMISLESSYNNKGRKLTYRYMLQRAH